MDRLDVFGHEFNLLRVEDSQRVILCTDCTLIIVEVAVVEPGHDNIPRRPVLVRGYWWPLIPRLQWASEGVVWRVCAFSETVGTFDVFFALGCRILDTIYISRILLVDQNTSSVGVWVGRWVAGVAGRAPTRHLILIAVWVTRIGIAGVGIAGVAAAGGVGWIDAVAAGVALIAAGGGITAAAATRIPTAYAATSTSASTAAPTPTITREASVSGVIKTRGAIVVDLEGMAERVGFGLSPDIECL
jgi:hypothetical protein